MFRDDDPEDAFLSSKNDRQVTFKGVVSRALLEAVPLVFFGAVIFLRWRNKKL